MSTPFEAIKGISLSPTQQTQSFTPSKSILGGEEEGSKFENIFTNYMGTANQTLLKAKDLGDQVATGDLKSLHKLSIAGMKAEIMMKLTTQIAAKLSSACTTLFQMQM